jgi:hypothetical protein
MLGTAVNQTDASECHGLDYNYVVKWCVRKTGLLVFLGGVVGGFLTIAGIIGYVSQDLWMPRKKQR